MIPVRCFPIIASKVPMQPQERLASSFGNLGAAGGAVLARGVASGWDLIPGREMHRAAEDLREWSVDLVLG
jgi:hypothetical protein